MGYDLSGARSARDNSIDAGTHNLETIALEKLKINDVMIEKMEEQIR